MSLIRFSPSFDPFQEMEEMTGRYSSARPSITNSFIPALDVYETKEAVIVESPLAGTDPNNVSVSVENGLLTISGESRKEHELEEKNYYRKEVRTGSFYRQVPLPTSVEENKVVAEFIDGILKITCPKTDLSPTKKITVKVIKKDELTKN